MVIKLENISYMDEAECFLKNISINFSVNNIYFILGKSGSSKTTLLDIITGIKKPVSGLLSYDENITISYVKYNSDTMFLTNNVYEEIKIISLLKKIDNLDELLYKLKLDKSILNRKIDTLSKIEKKKITLLLALLENRSVLVLDEPSIGMSYEEKVNLSKIIKNIKKDKIVIISSKDTEFMLLLESIIYVINDRRIIKKGTRYEILNDFILLKKLGLKIPDVLFFIKLVYKEKQIKLPNRDNILDLIKDVYRNV